MRWLIAAALVVSALPAAAQMAPVQREAENGRFVLRDSPEGLLRMDTRTGAVSVCTRRVNEFTCRLVPDDRAALEAEIEQLRAENERLKRTAGASAPPAPPAAQLPSDQEVDRMLSLAERIWKRFRDLMREEQQPNRL